MTVRVRCKYAELLRGVAVEYDPHRLCYGAKTCVRVVWGNWASTVEWRRLDGIVFVVPAGRRVIE